MDAMDAIRKVFDVLDPPDRVQFTDLKGEVYDRSTMLSARAQIRVIRALRPLADVQIEIPSKPTMKQVMIAMLEAAVEPNVEAAIEQAFVAAYPDILRPGEIAFDKFGIEELLTALVPTFVRPIGKISRTVGGSNRKSLTETISGS